MPRDQRFLILADGLFGPDSSKTANACIRYTPERVVGVIDATRAGSTAADVVGFGGDISVVSTLGTPVDVTAQELRVESFFPVDDATAAGWQRVMDAPASARSAGGAAAQS